MEQPRSCLTLDSALEIQSGLKSLLIFHSSFSNDFFFLKSTVKASVRFLCQSRTEWGFINCSLTLITSLVIIESTIFIDVFSLSVFLKVG